MIRQNTTASPDVDTDAALERQEWCDALRSLAAQCGSERAREMLDLLSSIGRDPAIGWQPQHGTPYVNTVPVDRQPVFPGDLAIEERLASIMRWNALAMVARANAAYGELGGHIASYASAADLFEVGFNHFFRARTDDSGGDVVFFQPHSAPGVYARAFLEGRLSEHDLAHYRQEITARRNGACSATARWTSPSPCRHSRWPRAKGWTIWSGWSTAICSGSMARYAATAASSMSWKRCSAAPAGT